MLPVSTRCPARVACGLVAFALVSCLFAPPARAQSTWLDHGHRASGLLEVLFPSFDGEDTKFPDWTWYATGRFPLGGETHFVGELPFTQMDLVGTTSEATIGNPYLGVEYAPRPSGPLVEFGVRIPLTSDKADSPWINGYLTDVEREEAFVPDALPVRLGVHHHHAAAVGGVSYDVRLVPSIWIKTNDKFLNETETFLGYGGIVRYEGAVVRAGGGLTGRWNLSSNGRDFGASTFHQAEFAVDFLRGPVRPGIQLKLPLDHDLTQIVNQSWGFTLSMWPR